MDIKFSPIQEYLFIVIGCGGIGGNLARDLPKIAFNEVLKHFIVLVDGDNVDKKNLVRQPYQAQDLGKNKARVLASKINTFYHISALYHDQYIVDLELNQICKKYERYVPVFLGCVDNDATRELIEKTYFLQKKAVYIDGANSVNEGNVFASCIIDGIQYGKTRGQVYQLSNDDNPGLKSCEDLVAEGNTQILITNAKIALVMLEQIYTLLNDFCIKVGVTDVDRFKIIHYS